MTTKTKTEGVIKSGDMAAKNLDNRFSALDLSTLQTIADYFGADKEETITEQVVALASSGITYPMYAKEFKIPLPEDNKEETIDDVLDEDEDEAVEPITVSRERILPQAEYLIKMTRDNPYFEVASLSERRKVFKFTTEHPYAIMDARSAQYVLQNETGFRQAFPEELEEFYN